MSVMNNISWPGWDIVGIIGRGSFGTVYKIQREVYGDLEEAALKVIVIPRSEDEVDYLRCTGLDDHSITQTFHQQVGDIAREYKMMSQMRDNPNIVRCDDFRDIQHDDGLGWDVYIKMELLTPLMKALETVKTEEQIIRLGTDLCNALVACQEKNIIHRDIKPQNVFVSQNSQFKLGDFGIARTVERTTRATAGIGTYSYMAPEVEKNEPYGKSADIYSLGLLMYWLLNERRSPFMPLPPAVPKYGDEEKARNRRFSGEQIPAPAHGSERLKEIVLKACAYDPKERYQTAGEMLEDINWIQQKEIVSRMFDLEFPQNGSKQTVGNKKDTLIQCKEENESMAHVLPETRKLEKYQNSKCGSGFERLDEYDEELRKMQEREEDAKKEQVSEQRKTVQEVLDVLKRGREIDKNTLGSATKQPLYESGQFFQNIDEYDEELRKMQGRETVTKKERVSIQRKTVQEVLDVLKRGKEIEKNTLERATKQPLYESGQLFQNIDEYDEELKRYRGEQKKWDRG